MATVQDTTSPLSEVQIEALVVMRIIKHATSTFPTPATGFLVGTDVASQLQVTNSFPLPAAPMDKEQQDSYHQPDAATLATAAPRAKSNISYQNEMIKLLREVNVDAQSVGWYMSTNMGNFISQSSQFRGPARDDHQVGTLPGQLDGERPPDAPRGASDQCARISDLAACHRICWGCCRIPSPLHNCRDAGQHPC